MVPGNHVDLKNPKLIIENITLIFFYWAAFIINEVTKFDIGFYWSFSIAKCISFYVIF
jgi:hypothetical protein